MQPSRIHHVGLPVTDLDISVAWYREALGLTHDAAAGVPGGVAFMVAPTGERLELLAVDVQPSTWDEPIAALRAGVPHTAWTVDDLDDAYARAVEAGGRSVWTPRDTPEPGLRIAFVADPDGNLVELLSREGKLLRPDRSQRYTASDLTRPVGGVAVVEEDGVAGWIADPGPMADTRIPHLVDLHAGRLELRLRVGDVRHTQRERARR